MSTNLEQSYFHVPAKSIKTARKRKKLGACSTWKCALISSIKLELVIITFLGEG
jgi:hypothetical protein